MPGEHEEADIDVAVGRRFRRAIAEIDQADFERVDPPADLWSRIEASIAADTAPDARAPHGPPKEPPSADIPAGIVVEYWIDAADIVTEVGESWAGFARDNDAAELADRMPDKTLWDYFGTEEIRDLWRLLVERVRSTQTPARVPLRCDAPHARRWFDMAVTPRPDGWVHFRSVLVFEERREPVTLLDPHSERDGHAQPIPLCSWCGRGQHGSAWLDIEELVRAARLLEQTSMPPIDYGICSPCRDEMSAELLVPASVDRSVERPDAP